jgi:hypothetical protein
MNKRLSKIIAFLILTISTLSANASIQSGNTEKLLYLLRQSIFCQSATKAQHQGTYSLKGNLAQGLVTVSPKKRTTTHCLSGGFWHEYMYHTDLGALIVAGGGPELPDWEESRFCAYQAYHTLTTQGYLKKNIVFLSAGSLNDITDSASIANLEKYLADMGNKELYSLVLYMVDHGDTDTFNMNPTEILHAKNHLSPWLKGVQENIPGPLIMVYDACRSGSFINSLELIPGKKRILITSSQHNQDAIALQAVSFSSLFWTEIIQGHNILVAFDTVYHYFDRSNYKQKPQLDADGDRITNERKDYELASLVSIGQEIPSWNAPPYLEGYPNETTEINSDSAKIYVNKVVDASGIGRVWAVIVPPDYKMSDKGELITDLPTVELTHCGGDAYEGEYSGFNLPGKYTISLYAMDAREDMPLLSVPISFQYIRKRQFCRDLNKDGQITLNDLILSLMIGVDIKPELQKEESCLRKGIAEAIYIIQTIGNNQ